MFITCVFKEVISESIKAIMAEETFIVAFETVSNGICTELALFGGLVEEEVVVTFKAVCWVVEVSGQTII